MKRDVSAYRVCRLAKNSSYSKYTNYSFYIFQRYLINISLENVYCNFHKNWKSTFKECRLTNNEWMEKIELIIKKLSTNIILQFEIDRLIWYFLKKDNSVINNISSISRNISLMVRIKYYRFPQQYVLKYWGKRITADVRSLRSNVTTGRRFSFSPPHRGR